MNPMPCENCGDPVKLEQARILHHATGARAVCALCWAGLRPGAPANLARYGNLLQPQPAPAVVPEDRPEPGRFTRNILGARKNGGAPCQTCHHKP